jgi:hypothetical protein
MRLAERRVAFEVFGDLAIEIEESLEIVGVVMGPIDDQRFVLWPFRSSRSFLRRERGVALLQFQRGIFDQLLLDALLQLLQGKLQYLHRLDHPGRQFLNLELTVFEAEG